MKLLFKAYRCSARALLAMFLAELVGPTVTSPCSPTAACFCLANSNREREGEEKCGGGLHKALTSRAEEASKRRAEGVTGIGKDFTSELAQAWPQKNGSHVHSLGARPRPVRRRALAWLRLKNREPNIFILAPAGLVRN
jgi:hypothetical protein